MPLLPLLSYRSRPTASLAKSASSLEGSLPAVVMSRMGCLADVARSAWMAGKPKGGGDRLGTRSASDAYLLKNG